MRHWNIGAAYKDYKRNKICILIAISPYKAKTGSYLDFKYIDGTYNRQPASKALSRFEMVGDASQTGTGDIFVSNEIMDQIEASHPEKVIHPTKSVPKTKRVSKQNVLVWYANVIYIDFIKKCRIVVNRD